jgi:hypothetical protein
MNILFFDVVPTNIVRFFKGVVTQFDKHSADINLFFLVEEDDHNDISHVQKNYPTAHSIEYVQARNIQWYMDYFSKNGIDSVIINAQRIPDDMVILACKKLGIKTFMLQHGMYVPFLKRNLKFFISKIGKTIRYLYYSLGISKELGYGYGGLVSKYFKCYVLGANQVQELIPREQLNVDKVYVYGEFWKEFHKSQFGYSMDSQTTVGYPELQDIYGKNFSFKSNGVCYIAQTLVEDGRLPEEVQLAFFSCLLESTAELGLDLHIKLHPRSDASLFRAAKNFKHVIFHQDEFPAVTKYIGHYSTLLAKGMVISGDVGIYEYKGHPTPSYFEESASAIISNLTDLPLWLKKSKSIDNQKIQKYFECRKNVYKTVAEDIIKHTELETKDI